MKLASVDISAFMSRSSKRTVRLNFKGTLEGAADRICGWKTGSARQRETWGNYFTSEIVKTGKADYQVKYEAAINRLAVVGRRDYQNCKLFS